MANTRTEFPPIVVTQAQLFPVADPNSKLRGFARILLNDQLQLTSLRLYDGAHGLFVSYPNDPAHKGDDYRQLYYPVSKDLKEAIERIIIDLYNGAATGGSLTWSIHKE